MCFIIREVSWQLQLSSIFVVKLLICYSPLSCCSFCACSAIFLINMFKVFLSRCSVIRHSTMSFNLFYKYAGFSSRSTSRILICGLCSTSFAELAFLNAPRKSKCRDHTRSAASSTFIPMATFATASFITYKFSLLSCHLYLNSVHTDRCSSMHSLISAAKTQPVAVSICKSTSRMEGLRNSSTTCVPGLYFSLVPVDHTAQFSFRNKSTIWLIHRLARALHARY